MWYRPVSCRAGMWALQDRQDRKVPPDYPGLPGREDLRDRRDLRDLTATPDRWGRSGQLDPKEYQARSPFTVTAPMGH